MSSLRRVLDSPKPHQTAEGDGPMLKENHQEVKDTNEAEPKHWPETREVLPRQVDFLGTIRTPDILARKQRRQGRAVTVLRIGYSPTLFLGTCESVVVLLAYGKETLESTYHNIRRTGFEHTSHTVAGRVGYQLNHLRVGRGKTQLSNRTADSENSFTYVSYQVQHFLVLCTIPFTYLIKSKW